METGPLTQFDLPHMQRLPLVPISVPPPGPAHGVAKRLRSGFPFRNSEVRILPPQPAFMPAPVTHTTFSGAQSFTPTSAGFGNRVLVGDPLHNSARNGSTAGKITGTKDAHGQCFVEPAELHRVYPAVADAAGNAAATPHLAMDDAAALEPAPKLIFVVRDGSSRPCAQRVRRWCRQRHSKRRCGRGEARPCLVGEHRRHPVVLAMAQQPAAMAEEKLGELKTLLNDMRA